MPPHRTTEQIDETYAAQGPAPLDGGRVTMLVRRPAVDAREVVEAGHLSLEAGLEGDSWLARGSRSMEDGRANPQAQVTLMNGRVLAALAPNRADWPLAGDQIIVDLDLSEENLPAGQRLAVGQAVIEVSALPHTGCAKFTERFGADAIRYVNGPQGRRERRRGLNARVIQPGAVAVGDAVRKI